MGLNIWISLALEFMTFRLRSLVPKMTTLNKTQPYSLLKHICMALYLTPQLEMLFNQMSIAKSNVQNRLTNSALNALPCIKVSKVPVNSFHKNCVSRCVKYWFKKKGRWMTQGKHKCYQCRKSNIFWFLTHAVILFIWKLWEWYWQWSWTCLVLYNDIYYFSMTLNVYF